MEMEAHIQQLPILAKRLKALEGKKTGAAGARKGKK
jgi:hypothetical protein